MRSIFTYPNNPGTQYIDPNYYGDSSSGFYQRIERLRSGNYKPWAGTAPLMNTTAIANMIGRYYAAHDQQNGNDNISLESLWQYPTHAHSMREKMWPVTTYTVGSDNGYAFKMLSNPGGPHHSLVEGESIKIRDATIDAGLNTDTPVKYASQVGPTQLIIQSYNDTLGYITNDTSGISILGGHTSDVVTTYDAYDKVLKDEGDDWIDSIVPLPFVKSGLNFYEENFAEANPDDTLGPPYDYGTWGLVMKLHPDVLPNGSSLVTGNKVTFVGDWGRDPARQLHGIVDNYPYGSGYVNGFEIQHHGQIKYDFYVKKIDTYTYHCYEDAGLTHRLHKDITGRRHYSNTGGLPVFSEYDKTIGDDIKQWYYSNDDTIEQWAYGFNYMYSEHDITTTNTDFFLENISFADNKLWTGTPNGANSLRTGGHQYLRANPRGWCYIRLHVDPFSVSETNLRANQSLYYSSPSVNADSNGNTGSRGIGFERDGLDGSGAIYTVDTGQLFFYEFDSATEQFTFYEREFDVNAVGGSGNAREDTPIASFTTGTLESAPGVLQHDTFRIECEFAQPIHIQPHVTYAGAFSTYLNDYGIMYAYEAADDMRVFRADDIQINGDPYYEVDTDYIAIYGDQRYYNLTGPDTYTPGARWLPLVWWEPGTELKNVEPDEYIIADSMISLDSNGRLSALESDPAVIPYGSPLRGKFRTNTERSFWLTSALDTYTVPAPTPLELEDIWDTADQWLDTGYDPDKVWAYDICPRSATVTVAQPSSTNLSQNGTKYVRSANYAKFQLEVEYPPLTAEQFKQLFGVAQAARGQTVPFYFKLVYNDKHIMFGETKPAWTHSVHYLNDVTAGDKLVTLHGFPSNSDGAIDSGDLLIAEVNANGHLSTAINSADSNIFGEVKARVAYPYVQNKPTGSRVYNRPFWAVVTLADDNFIYSVDYDDFYRVKVVFDLDEWK